MLSRSAPSKNGSASLTLKRRASSPSVLSTSKERNMSHKAWTASPSMAATSIRSASTAPLAVYRCTKTAFILNQDGVVSTPPVSSVPGSLIGLPRSSPRKPLNNSSRRNLLRLRVHQKPAKAVNQRRHLLRPGQTHLPGMPPEAPQGVEALPRDFRQRLLDRRPDPPVAAAREPADDAGCCLRLARLGELLHGGEVDPLPPELDRVGAPAPGRLPLTAAEVQGRGPQAASPRPTHLTRLEWGAGREAPNDLVGAFHGVKGCVVLEQYHPVRHLQVV